MKIRSRRFVQQSITPFDLSIIPSLLMTQGKLRAIGIDPAFLSAEIKELLYDDIVRELDDLRADYEAMFPEDNDGF